MKEERKKRREERKHIAFVKCVVKIQTRFRGRKARKNYLGYKEKKRQIHQRKLNKQVRLHAQSQLEKMDEKKPYGGKYSQSSYTNSHGKALVSTTIV